jgi:HSP20 family molecular chaperone IbpA
MPPRPVFLPPADIYETKDAIVVLAEMPGVPPEGVDLTLERRVLTIRGRSAARNHTGYQRVYNEYTEGDYERVFTLRRTSTATGSRRGSRTACSTSSYRKLRPPRPEE